MTLPPPASPRPDRLLAIQRAEQALDATEQHLATERAQLESAAGSLLARLRQVQAMVAHGSSADPEWRTIQARAQHASVPALAVGELAERSLRTREEAIAVRHSAAEELQQRLREVAAELSRLSSQLTADEAALEQLQQRARDEAARRKEADATTDRVETSEPTTERHRTLADTQPERPRNRPEGRRGQPRVRLETAIDLSSESNFFTGFSTNLSEGGVFVATVNVVPLGTSVDLSFTLPPGKRVAVHGVVRWIREANDRTPEIFPGVGIQFVDLEPQTAELIRRFVDSREPIFFPT